VIRTLPRHGYRFIATLAEPAPRRFDPLRIEPDGLSPVHFAVSGEGHIAWRTLGDGPVDILVAPGFVSHLDMRFGVRAVVRFDVQLARHARLIFFDKRGVGLSDRVSQPRTLAQTAADMAAVLDAAGSRRTVLFGVSESGPACALFAATYPERTAALAVFGSFAKGIRSEDYPWLPPREVYDRWVDQIVGEWGGPASIELFAPNESHDPEIREAWARYLRAAATPSGMRAILEAMREIDVREVLPAIRAPTVVMHRRGDRLVRYPAGEDFARRIPGARFRLLEGDAHWWFVGDTQPMIDEIAGLLASDSSR
jgi:pimeloyl-ACP methyl ester carboxylesterase